MTDKDDCYALNGHGNNVEERVRFHNNWFIKSIDTYRLSDTNEMIAQDIISNLNDIRYIFLYFIDKENE